MGMAAGLSGASAIIEQNRRFVGKRVSRVGGLPFFPMGCVAASWADAPYSALALPWPALPYESPPSAPLRRCCPIARPRFLTPWQARQEITQAVIESLSPDDAIIQKLGVETVKLREHLGMPDRRDTLYRDKFVWFYANDYLLFPGATLHREPTSAGLREDALAFFSRALQALRTESVPNAGRWIGALLHFTEDCGSPAVAADITGDLRGKLETLADPKGIHIQGYQPILLGRTEVEALAGFQKRLEVLGVYSKQRAERAEAAHRRRRARQGRADDHGVRGRNLPGCGRSPLHAWRTRDRPRQCGQRDSAWKHLRIVPGGNGGRLDRDFRAYASQSDAGRHAVFHAGRRRRALRFICNLPAGKYTLDVRSRRQCRRAAGAKLPPTQDGCVRTLSLTQDAPAGNMLRDPSLFALAQGRTPGWLVSRRFTRQSG